MKQSQPINHRPSPSRQRHVPRRSPSDPTRMVTPIREQVMKHLHHRKQQQPGFRVSGQQESREKISQQVRQHRAFQKAGLEARGCKPKPVITKAVSSEDLASPSDAKLSPWLRLDVDDLPPQIAINQKYLLVDEDCLLSQSAPEHSLREMKARDKRSNSVTSKNLLKVPKWEWAVPLATFSSDDSVLVNRCSSALDLSSFASAELLGQSFNQPVWRSKSCEREAFHIIHPKSPKNSDMASPIRSVMSWMGLSPRSTPRASPASSRSPSPGSRRSSLSPEGSPFSPTNMMTIRPLIN